MEGSYRLDSRRILLTKLSNREIEIYLIVVNSADEMNEAIADKLCIVEKTLRYHLGNIYAKLGCRNRATLLNFHLELIKEELTNMGLCLNEFCNIIPIEHDENQLKPVNEREEGVNLPRGIQ